MTALAIGVLAAAFLYAAGAVFVGLTPDKGTRVRGTEPQRPRRQLAITAAADATAEIASMGRLRGLPVRPGTAYDCHSTYWEPREQPRESRPAPGESPMKVMSSVQALVYDDPLPGREYDAPLEVRHRAAEVAPYCSRPRCGDRAGHWTESHLEPGPAAEALLAERERAVRLPDYVLAPDAMNGHLTVDSLVDSIVFRKIGSADG